MLRSIRNVKLLKCVSLICLSPLFVFYSSLNYDGPKTKAFKNNPIPVKTLILGSFMDDIWKKIHNRLFFLPLNLVSNAKNSTPPPPSKVEIKKFRHIWQTAWVERSLSEVRVEGSWHTSQNNSKDLKQERAVYRHTPHPLKKKNREVSLPDLFEGSGRREGQPGVESRFGSRREGGKQSLIWSKWLCTWTGSFIKKYFQKLEDVWKCSIIPVPDSKCSLFSITKSSSLLMLHGRSLLPRNGSHLHGLPTCFLWLRSIIKCLIKLHFCSYKHVFQRFTSLVGYDWRSFENCFQQRLIFY